MTVKVCILAAGKGTRIASFGGALHKALLPLGNLAIISHIIGQFPDDAEIIVAVGHLADQVRDYLAIAHPERAFIFVPVDPFEGPGAGPGLSLWCCREHLQKPFYLTACDTLISTAIPPLEINFMGTQPVDDPTLWCTVETTSADKVAALHYKVPQGTREAFVGFAGIVDTSAFWNGLGSRIGGATEYQVDDGFRALLAEGVRAVPVGWIDSGTEENYAAALPIFAKNFTFYGKSTDVTYRVDDRIIKFFADYAVSRARFERARANPAFGEVLDLRGGFFSSRFVEGTLLSRLLGTPAYAGALYWIERHFWRPLEVDRATFDEACHRFYHDKTLGRLSTFEKVHPALEQARLTINGVVCDTVREQVAQLPASFWAGALPSSFHGDLHDENIIARDDGSCVLIDWRQDFAGLPDAGDRYYDLAKFFHTLDLSVATMDAGRFMATWSGEAEVAIAHEDDARQQSEKEGFWRFARQAGHDLPRILLLNGLIFINMAPLYEDPLSEYLYLLGRLRLAEALDAASQ